MSCVGDVDALREAYEDVRKDDNAIAWLVAKYDNGGAGKTLEIPETGEDYEELLEKLGCDERAYCYVRFECGDEMSKRAKFAFITWIGQSVPPLKKAKVSTDKAFVKLAMPQFGKEILADEKGEIKKDKVQKILEQASGAAYGTGK